MYLVCCAANEKMTYMAVFFCTVQLCPYFDWSVCFRENSCYTCRLIGHASITWSHYNIKNREASAVCWKSAVLPAPRVSSVSTAVNISLPTFSIFSLWNVFQRMHGEKVTLLFVLRWKQTNVMKACRFYTHRCWQNICQIIATPLKISICRN